MMNPLFAHHDMLEAFDFLDLKPVTSLDHGLALATYTLLAVALALGLRWAGRRLSRQFRSAQAYSEPLSAIMPRTVEE
jgi:hypothetical protein